MTRQQCSVLGDGDGDDGDTVMMEWQKEKEKRKKERDMDPLYKITHVGFPLVRDTSFEY